MTERDFIIEQILSIEDFSDVDEKLMSEILSDEEYRRIFEDCKEISELTRECVPEPVKDGLTLRQAVTERVRNGQTAPRYVNTSSGKFRFPFATAACVVVVMAVMFVASNNGRNKMYDSTAYNGAGKESMRFAAEEESAPILKDAKFMAMAPGTAENYSKDDADGIAVVSENETADEETGAGGVFKAETPAVTPKGAANTYMYSSGEYIPEMRVDVSESILADSVQEECESENKAADISVSAEVISRVMFANKHSIPEEKRITYADIEKYGEDNFIAWFDGIKDSPDFLSLYGIDEFAEYCEALN